MALQKSRLLYLGGNGHCAARLAAARLALPHLAATGQITPFDLIDVPYPGFEGRPRAANLEEFLTAIAGAVQNAEGAGSRIYATGIGGLLALCLRARGQLGNTPLLLQAPILWGLEHRFLPRLLRFNLPRAALGWMFARPWFQRRFAAKQFERRPSTETLTPFFAGYAACASLPDLFAWITPALLRDLEGRFRANPGGLDRVNIWWGGLDRVVGLRELEWTQKALGTTWPVRLFPTWGHYPMMDEPEEWVRALSDVLASPE